jgi:hypothetical protein
MEGDDADDPPEVEVAELPACGDGAPPGDLGDATILADLANLRGRALVTTCVPTVVMSCQCGLHLARCGPASADQRACDDFSGVRHRAHLAS